MDTANNLIDHIAQLITRVHDPKDVEKLQIVQHQTAALQSEHLATMKANRKIMAEHLELSARVKVLEQQIARLKLEGREIVAEPDEFIEHLGVLFCRKPGGRYHRKPFCPKCHRSMKEVSRSVPYTCTSCKTFTSFTPAEINDVLLALKRG